MSTIISPLLDIGTLSEKQVSEYVEKARQATTLEELIEIQNIITCLAVAQAEYDMLSDEAKKETPIKVYTHVRPEWVRSRKVHNDEWIAEEANIAILRAKSEARQEVYNAMKNEGEEYVDVPFIQSIDQTEPEDLCTKCKPQFLVNVTTKGKEKHAVVHDIATIEEDIREGDKLFYTKEAAERYAGTL